MTANYHCPNCHGQLVSVGVEGVFKCQRCREIVAEAFAKGGRRVREFYRRASPAGWGGLRGR